jgi:hypothetical protein
MLYREGKRHALSDDTSLTYREIYDVVHSVCSNMYSVSQSVVLMSYCVSGLIVHEVYAVCYRDVQHDNDAKNCSGDNVNHHVGRVNGIKLLPCCCCCCGCCC